MFPDNTKINFYRARIGDFISHNDSQILAPPKGTASAGRCNPEGISYLYLALDEKTAISEVRPKDNDLLTIAKLKVDVSNIFSFRPFATDIKLSNLIGNPHVQILSWLIDADLSSSIASNNKLDYIPLQFISEYIKNLGFDGFVYSSTIGPGMNLVMFNWENKITILDKKLVTV